MVLAFVQMAGEPFSLWACRAGRDPGESADWIFVPDPRDRERQAEAFEQLAHVVNTAVEASMEIDLEPLQVWVTNPAAANNLRRLSRVMRARNISDEVGRAASYLDLYAQAASTPGSALCVVATEALRAHRVTGQSDFEDANLAAQLAWWDRRTLASIDSSVSKHSVRSLSTFEVAALAERLPMGTLTDPDFDERRLEPLVDKVVKAKRESRRVASVERQLADSLDEQVLPIWNALWEAHAQLAALPEAQSADERWNTDRKLFENLRTWLNGGGHVRFTDSPTRAARLLSLWEAHQTDLVRNTVLDDDIAMVEAILEAQAVAGTVTHCEVRKNGNKKHHFITLRTPPTAITAETALWYRAEAKVKCIVTEVDDHPKGNVLTLEVVAGMRNNPLPQQGEQAEFITLPPAFGRQPRLPRAAPWTHSRAIAEEVDDDEA